MRFLFPVLIMLAAPAWLAVYGGMDWARRKRDASPAGRGKNGGERRASAMEMHELKRRQTASHWFKP